MIVWQGAVRLLDLSDEDFRTVRNDSFAERLERVAVLVSNNIAKEERARSRRKGFGFSPLPKFLEGGFPDRSLGRAFRVAQRNGDQGALLFPRKIAESKKGLPVPLIKPTF